MSKSDFLERNQRPHDKKRTAVIETFIRKAGDKLEDLTFLAEELQESSGFKFERALAEALECYKIK
jgi:hypothetical protein